MKDIKGLPKRKGWGSVDGNPGFVETENGFIEGHRNIGRPIDWRPIIIERDFGV